jgi:hypothetical protein
MHLSNDDMNKIARRCLAFGPLSNVAALILTVEAFARLSQGDMFSCSVDDVMGRFDEIAAEIQPTVTGLLDPPTPSPVEEPVEPPTEPPVEPPVEDPVQGEPAP